MMNHPKLLPSQELALHQVSVDSFSPASASVLKFPTSPLLPRSPFATPGTPAAAAPAAASPLSTAGPTTASSIVRPQIRLRGEWEASLQRVDAFELGGTFLHTSSVDREAPVRVRYIADRYDRAWLSRRPVLALRQEDGVLSVVRGKTGSVGSHTPVLSTLKESTLEDVFTALELAAYAEPEVPLERLLPYARRLLGDAEVSDEALEELRAYWLLRRHALGGLLSSIPNLRAVIREDNELALCHPAVLRDCPLPFKQRDWYVPVVERRRPSASSSSSSNRVGDLKRPRSPPERDNENEAGGEFAKGDALSSAQLAASAAYVEKARRLSEVLLAREETRLAHTHLTLYELASLRAVVDAEEVPKLPSNAEPVPQAALAAFLAASRWLAEVEGVTAASDHSP